MLQHSGNPQSDDQDRGRDRFKNSESREQPGFEGMNYEQIRQPFSTGSGNRDEKNKSRNRTENNN